MPDIPSIYPPSFFRTLASLSEEAVLGTLSGIAHTRNRDAMNGLLQFFDEDGFPNPRNRTSFTINRKFDVQYEGEKEKISFSRFLMLVLAPENNGAFSDEQRKDALEVISLCLRIHEKHEKANSTQTKSDFLDGLIFDSASLVQDKAFFLSLIEMGASPQCRRGTWKESIFDECYLMTEATRHGNFALVEASVPHLQNVHAENLAMNLVAPYTSSKPGETTLFAQALQTHPESVINAIDSLDAKLDPEKIAKVRARVLSMHFEDCVENKKPWDENIVMKMVGDANSDSQAVIRLAAEEDAKTVKTEAPKNGPGQLQIWRELFEHALKAHCEPVVSLFEDRIKNSCDFDFKRPESPIHFACAHATPEETFDRQKFKATIQCLVAHGQDLSKCETSHPPALAMIAKTKDTAQVRAQKLAVLLELGVNQDQKNEFGMNISPTAKDGNKTSWNDVLRSFGARKAALSILEEMDAPSIKPG